MNYKTISVENMKKKKEFCTICEIERQKGRRWNRRERERELLADIRKRKDFGTKCKKQERWRWGRTDLWDSHLRYPIEKRICTQTARRMEAIGETEEREVRNLPP